MPYVPDSEISSPNLYSPLTLAFVGDAVYELYVRSRLMESGSLSANKLHKMAINYVKAAAQAKSMRAIESMLSEEESAIYKRGRNSKSATVPKNADMAEYRVATGFEALMGYLYLSKQSDRLTELMRISYEEIEKDFIKD